MKVNEQRQELDILVAKAKVTEADGFSGQQTPQIEKIDYDFLIIGVGSNYTFPIKEAYDTSLTQQQRD